jgi:hypothetical protein
MRELKAQPVWSPSYTKKGKEKAPLHDINKPATHQTYDQAYDTQAALNASEVHSHHMGIMPTLDDPYIYLDYDIDPQGAEDGPNHLAISEAFLAHLKKFPTYVESSPSGHGLHVIYKLGARDHEALRALNFTRISAKTQTLPFTGEVMFSSSYLILTERMFQHPDNVTPLVDIQTISLTDLCDVVPQLKRKLSSSATVIGIHSKQRLSAAPDINDMRERLMLLPAKMNFYTNRAYQGLSVPMEPNTYDHWVMIAMCLAHAALQSQDPVVHNEYYLLFDEWSQTDPEAYRGPGDTLDKWDSCLASTQKKMLEEANYKPALTKGTLHKLVNLCYPAYEKRDSKGRPIWESTKNLESAIKFHDLKFHADAYNFDSLYVECHKDVAERVFNDTFTRHGTGDGNVIVFLKNVDLSARKILEASQYYVPAIGKCLTPFKSMAVQEIDLNINKNVHDKFQMFIDETLWDGKPRVQSVIDTLHFDEHTEAEVVAHYRAGLYKCLLWLVAIRYHGKPASAPAVPILVGGEGIYKSTWVKSLLHGTPFALQYVKPIGGLMADRKELSRALQSTLIALIDEIETSLKNADKAKDVLTEETLSLRAHYVNSYVNVMKRGLMFGTTNNPYMNASDDGNRRLFRITVQKCDTDALWKIDMQQVFAELKHDYLELKKKGDSMPWVFTKAENAMNNRIMGLAATQSEDAMLLHEFFGGAPEDFEFDPAALLGKGRGCKQNERLIDEGHATTVRKLTNDLVAYLQEQNFNVTIRPPNGAVIKRKLQSFAAKYTDTEHKARVVGLDLISNGIMTLKKQTLFIVPPRKAVKK